MLRNRQFFYTLYSLLGLLHRYLLRLYQLLTDTLCLFCHAYLDVFLEHLFILV